MLVKNTALLCGLVRDPAAYNHKLDTLLRWRAEGCLDEIVISTWLGELANFPEIRDRLRSEGCRVVETSEPEVCYKGHTWHQMKTLAFGLEACEAGSAVLKLRADKMELSETIRSRLAERRLTPCAPPAGWPCPLTARVSILAGILTQPFFLNDIMFYGLREDLARLVNFDVSLHISGGLMNPEQLFFMAPFIGHFPIFRQFFRVNWGLLHFDYQRRDAKDLLLGSWQFRFYRESMMTWFLILNGYFDSLDVDQSERSEDAYVGWDLTSFFDIDDARSRPGVYFDGNINTFSFKTLDFMEAMVERRFARDELSDAVQASLDCVTPYSRQQQYGHVFMGLDAEATAWAEFVRGFPYGDMQLIHLRGGADRLWQVRTPPLQMTIATGG